MGGEIEAKKSSTGKVSQDQVRKAVQALLKWTETERKKQKTQQLLEDDDLIHLVVSLKKVPVDSRTNGYRIPLPHSIYPLGSGNEVCLIVKDSDEKGHKEAKEKIRAEGNSGVTKVLGVRKLRSKYKPFEAKRQLCGSFDVFLADDRVIPTLPKLLGKTFFQKKKHPIPVNLRGKDWSKSIREACDSTYLYISGGACSVVRAARTSQEEDEIVDNIMAVIEGVAYNVPKKWKNIRTLFVKTTESIALPVFTAPPDEPTKIAS